ncbi:MAG: ribonuclease E/G, partial [Rhodoblastus sp.]|nr:ribonuclease E/G [Rhodoblastus sp.]
MAHDASEPLASESQPVEASADSAPATEAEAVVVASVAAEAVAEPLEIAAEQPAEPVQAETEEAAHTLAIDEQGYATISESDDAPNSEDVGETPDHEVKARRIEERDDEASDDEDEDEEEHVEQIGGDAMEEMPRRQPRLRRQYKIQEVIKRRQVLLVQVVKEERGNKGAALTTYLS